MMIKKMLSKLSFFTLFVYGFGIFGFFSFSFTGAQNIDFAIIPESEVSSDQVIKDVKELADSPGSVWDKYREKADDEKRSLGEKLASGIMTRDTLLDYVVYLIKFMSQLGLVIGALMFIYAGYMYATDVLGGDPSQGTKAMKYAIIGVVVLSFSYAIMKILTNMFIE